MLEVEAFLWRGIINDSFPIEWLMPLFFEGY